jgi:hypothetical protein
MNKSHNSPQENHSRKSYYWQVLSSFDNTEVKTINPSGIFEVWVRLKVMKGMKTIICETETHGGKIVYPSFCLQVNSSQDM